MAKRKRPYLALQVSVVLVVLILFLFNLIGWFLWMLGKSFVVLYQDWRLGHELDELKAQAASKQEKSTEPVKDGETDAADYTAHM